MNSIRVFDKPQKLIDRASRAVTDADSVFATWLRDERNLTNVIDVDAQTGEKVRKVTVNNGLPDVIEERFTDAVNNARNSFDQILFAACAAIGRPIGDGHYPWADNGGRALDWKFQNMKTGEEHIPRELWDVLRAQEPYPAIEGQKGGDTFLRTMATFANRKHTVGVEVGCSVSSIGFHGAYIGKGTKSAEFGPARFDAEKQEIVLMRWRGEPPQLKKEPDLTFYIAFDATAPKIVRSRTAVDGTLLFIEAAQRALDALKARAVELGAT